jgi:acetyltransferase-like isoleucine patch superfamily enzyme
MSDTIPTTAAAAPPHAPGHWTNGPLPANARVGAGTVISGGHAFARFLSTREEALLIGEQCTLDGCHFALGKAARVSIGRHCYFTNAVLLCEDELRFGDYVVIGWNATIADSDFHPLAPADRIADAVACSPLGKGRPRPRVEHRPVVVGNDVWIGPNATILKGVTVGDGAWIEPGALVTRDVPPGARVLGNPAQVIGEVRGA